MALAVVLCATALAAWLEHSAPIMLTVVGPTQITKDSRIKDSQACS
jgi:hypothetical protein